MIELTKIELQFLPGVYPIASFKEITCFQGRCTRIGVNENSFAVKDALRGGEELKVANIVYDNYESHFVVCESSIIENVKLADSCLFYTNRGIINALVTKLAKEKLSITGNYFVKIEFIDIYSKREIYYIPQNLSYLTTRFADRVGSLSIVYGEFSTTFYSVFTPKFTIESETLSEKIGLQKQVSQFLANDSVEVELYLNDTEIKTFIKYISISMVVFSYKNLEYNSISMIDYEIKPVENLNLNIAKLKIKYGNDFICNPFTL